MIRLITLIGIGIVISRLPKREEPFNYPVLNLGQGYEACRSNHPSQGDTK